MTLLLADFWSAQIWYSVPLVIAISLVYGATRHEFLREILINSAKALGWVMTFMLIIFVLVWYFSRNL